MRDRISAIYWGILLIGAGLVWLASELWLEIDPTEEQWAFILGAGSVLCLVGYLIGDKKRWGLLFPAAALAVGSLAIWLDNRETDSELVGGLVTATMSIPFWAAVVVDRNKNKWAVIPGGIMAGIGLLLIFFQDQNELFAALFFLLPAAGFFVYYLTNRKHWWPLIPAYVLTVLAIIILIANRVRGEYIGAFFMFAVALPFFVVYLVNRQNRWALIPAYVLTAVGLIPLLVGLADDEWIATAVLLLIALPFFAVYLRDSDSWWALIPAGVLTSVGVSLIPVFLNASDQVLERVVPSVILLGIAVTFAFLWTRRKLFQTEWAKYPAVGCLLAAILVGIFGLQTELIWALALITAGIWIIYRGQKPKFEG